MKTGEPSSSCHFPIVDGMALAQDDLLDLGICVYLGSLRISMGFV